MSHTANVHLNGDITLDSIQTVMEGIDKANNDDEVDRVRLFIASGGGKLYAEFALFDYIKQSSKPVDTVATGYCASAAVTILQAGAKRYATENTVIMIHPSSWSYDNVPYEAFRLQHEQSDKVNDLHVTLVAQRAGLPRKELESLFEPIHFLTPSEALKVGTNGLIDEILA